MSNQQTDNTETRRQAVQNKLKNFREIDANLKKQTNFSDKLAFINSQTKALSDAEKSFVRLRERWFVYREDIKTSLEQAKQKIPGIYAQSENIIRNNRDSLLRQIDDFHRNVMQVALQAKDPLENEQPVQILEQELEKVKHSINTIGSSLDGLISKVAENIDINSSLLKYLHWCIDQFIELKYSFEHGENIVAFDMASYLVSIDGKEKKIPGALYVTDRRFVFERRERVVTKRTLGIFASETKDVIEILLKEDVSSIKSMSNEVGGIVFKDFILKLHSHQDGKNFVFYVAGENLSQRLYYQIGSLLKGNLHRVSR